MSVHKRPDGKYLVRVYNPHGGREYRKIVAGKRAADAHEADVRARFARGSLLDPHGGKVTFGEYALEVVESRLLAANTKLHYLRDVERLRPLWGHRPLRSLRHTDAVTLTSYARDKWAGNGASAPLILARSICRQAVNDGLMERNPFSGIRLWQPRASRPEREASYAEVRAVLEGSDRLVKSRLQAAVLAGTGLRAGELAGMSLDGLDALRRTYAVRRQLQYLSDGAARELGLGHGGPYLTEAKTEAGEDRVIPLPSWVVELVALWLAKSPAVEVELPWGSPASTELRRVELIWGAAQPASISACIRTQAKAVGADWSPHDLRHLYATTLEQSGVPLRTLQYVLGHAPAGVTGIYSHVRPATLDLVRDVLALEWEAAAGPEGSTAAEGLG